MMCTHQIHWNRNSAWCVQMWYPLNWLKKKQAPIASHLTTTTTETNHTTDTDWKHLKQRSTVSTADLPKTSPPPSKAGTGQCWKPRPYVSTLMLKKMQSHAWIIMDNKELLHRILSIHKYLNIWHSFCIPFLHIHIQILVGNFRHKFFSIKYSVWWRTNFFNVMAQPLYDSHNTISMKTSLSTG